MPHVDTLKRRSFLILSYVSLLLLVSLSTFCTQASRQNISNIFKPTTPQDTLGRIDTLSHAIEEPEDTITYAYVKVDIANVRSQPTTNSKIILKLKRAEGMVLKEQVGEWWHIIVQDTISGYIHDKLITTNGIEVLEPLAIFVANMVYNQAVYGYNLLVGADTLSTYTLAVSFNNLWYGMFPHEQKLACLNVYNSWLECLKIHGLDPSLAGLWVYDSYGIQVAKVDRTFWTGELYIELK